MELSQRSDREERAGRMVEKSGLYDDYAQAKQAYKRLYEATRPGSKVDWEKVKKAADGWADLLADKTDGTTGNAVTGHEIAATLDGHGAPQELHLVQIQAKARLKAEVEKFVPTVRGGAGRRPHEASLLTLKDLKGYLAASLSHTP
ncbi:hypothetical protein [Streptomyces sp. NPDC055632]